MKSILDPTFRYVPAANTDLRETFKRVQQELAEKEKVEPDKESAQEAGAQ